MRSHLTIISMPPQTQSQYHHHLHLLLLSELSSIFLLPYSMHQSSHSISYIHMNAHVSVKRRRKAQPRQNSHDDVLDQVSSTEDDQKPIINKNNKSCDSEKAEQVTHRRKRKKKSHGEDSHSGPHPPRSVWVKDRSGAWWQKCNQPDFPEEDFKKAFRMKKSTFDMICDELNPTVAKGDTSLRNAIPVRQRVAVCLWRLATGDPLRIVSQRFGLGISTCHKLILEVCTAIKNVLMRKYLQWPDELKIRRFKSEFENISGIPNVVGSMYTSHVPIGAPKVNVTAYYNKKLTERNQKTCYSVTVQGVVDPRGLFSDVSIGWPGSMSDDEVLEKSAIYEKASNGGLLNGMWVVGNSGYPLMDWVLVPYTQKNLTWTQHALNEKIEKIGKVSRDAFARLKGRWGCLQKRTEVKLQDLPLILGACCVLHNICEFMNEEMDPELNFEVVDDEVVPEVALRSVYSMKARDLIAHNLLHHGFAGTPSL